MNDFKLATKSLGRSPGYTLIAIVTLGLGIGANTSMFSILNGYTLRPAPYADRDRLDRIYRTTRQERRGGISPADYLDLKSQTSGYGEIAAYTGTDLSLSEPGKPAEMADSLRVSANLFSTLGARPELGRTFRPDEETLGNHRVLVISHRYWQNHFGGDSHIIGRKVRVDSEPYEIVGVLPATFSDWRHLSGVDVFRPLGLTEKETRDRNSTRMRLVGLRAPTVPRAQGEAFVAEFGQRMAREFPAAHADSLWRSVAIDDSFIDKDDQPIISMLIGLSGFVVLIACSNLANLLLARTMGRAREFAVRSALGASRSHAGYLRQVAEARPAAGGQRPKGRLDHLVEQRVELVGGLLSHVSSRAPLEAPRGHSRRWPLRRRRSPPSGRWRAARRGCRASADTRSASARRRSAGCSTQPQGRRG